MTAPSIVEIHPADTADGIILSDQIYVVFDREVDRTTVQILLEGPDTDRWSGPEQVRWDNPDTDADDDILATPGYKGMVAGTITFEKVDESGNGVSAYDYTGGGALWRTKAILTPSEPLAANTEYRVWVVGDETTGDDIVSGVSSRTVFDVVKGSNLGSGDAYFSGGYSGTVPEDAYTVRIREAGDASDKLLFQYWRDSSPTIVRELYTSERSQLLADDVYVRFSGSFEVNDEFSVQLRTGDRMLNTYTWTFTTGAGSIESIPSTVVQTPSVPIDGFGSSTSTSSSTTFSVVEVTPAERATDLDPYSVEAITVKFSSAIDEDTVSDDTVEVWTEPVNGDFHNNSIEFSGVLTKILAVNGDTLTIQIT